MNRRELLITGGLGVLGLAAFQWRGKNMINQLLNEKNSSPRMPVLFIGHGSPMNAIEDNTYTRRLLELGKTLPAPKAILVVSAHWLTDGTFVTEAAKPKTIHDFYGFPQALFDVQYPAPGNPDMAKLVQSSVTNPEVFGDKEQWGLDHGTWSVLKHMYPQANIPVLQLSINIRKSPEYHFQVGQQLKALREKGVLILGSGNLVHNLRNISWEKNAPGFDWAIEFDEWTKEKLLKKDFKSVMNDFHQTTAGKMSVPTMDHYYPLHYILGASDDKDELRFEYEEIQNGSISMRSISLS